MSINKVTVTGNLTRDPELRMTSSGMPVLGFGIAVNDRRKNSATGEWEDYPNFFTCSMFGRRAESVVQYLSKGSKVAIEGSLRWSQWEKDGQKRSKVEIIVNDIEFMSRSDRSNTPTYSSPQAYNAPAYQAAGQSQSPDAQGITAPATQPQQEPYTDGLYEEEIPF